MEKKEIFKISYWFRLILGLLLVLFIQCVPVNAAGNGTLTIRKFLVENYENLKHSTGSADDEANIPTDAKVMEGVEFKVEKLSVSGLVKEVPTTAPIDASFQAITKRTDANGEAKFSALPEGYYLVTERVPEDHTAQGAGKFVVSVPIRTQDAKGNVTTNFDVVVYPKNQRVQVEKEPNSERTVVGIGDSVTWTVKYPLGPDLKRTEELKGVEEVRYGKNFYITDTMDKRLDYVPGSAKLSYFDANANEITGLTLLEGTDYILTYNESTHELKIAFTDDVGTKKVADAQVATIMMQLETKVNASALNTVESLWNNAKIYYENESGDPYEHKVFPEGTDIEDSRVPKVHLGQIVLVKVDASTNEKLAGATFGLAETIQDAKKANFLKRDDASGEAKEITITTDGSGEATIKAIGAGTYYLMETSAPKGYEALMEPIKVTVMNDENANISRVTVENTKAKSAAITGIPVKPTGVGKRGMPTAPKTGDDVQLLGLVIVLVATAGIVVGLIYKKKKKSETKEVK